MAFGSESLALPEGVFTILRELIRERLGLQFDSAKRDALADKLTPRALECGFSSFLDYYYLLKYGPGADEEWPQVMDALSVPETYFWREMDQVRALVNVLVPQYAKAHPGEVIEIWCAACASGEEPLTIAMALDDAGWLKRAPFRIWASDASSAAVGRARAGIYRERSFRTLPPAFREKYFKHERDSWRVADPLHAQIAWSQANLMNMAEISPFVHAPFIFCRNVFIYFDANTIAKTVQRFAANMPRPGYLFTGVSESLVRLSSDFNLREVGEAFLYVLD